MAPKKDRSSATRTAPTKPPISGGAYDEDGTLLEPPTAPAPEPEPESA